MQFWQRGLRVAPLQQYTWTVYNSIPCCLAVCVTLLGQNFLQWNRSLLPSYKKWSKTNSIWLALAKFLTKSGRSNCGKNAHPVLFPPLSILANQIFPTFFCRNCFREIFHTFTNLMMFSTNYTAVIRFHLTSEFWAKLETQHSENVV